MGKGSGDGFKGTTGSGSTSRFSGELIKVNNYDSAADKLANRLRGVSCVRFANDPYGKEFDAVTSKYLAETKPALKTLNKRVRNQMRDMFAAAKETGREVYYHFNGVPAQEVIDKLNEYSERYGVNVVIDTTSFE